MIDLGKYAVAVISAYASGLGLIALLVGWTWVQSLRAKRRLAEMEQEKHG
jgi:heme exporter protein CcmD